MTVDKNQNVSLRPYGWSQEFSMLYIDNPIGTGFSYTNSSEGFSTNENSVADNLYEFLQQFYQIFHDFRDKDLYISGLSYAGKYIPSIGYKLMQKSNESKINFKGVAIGNGWIDPLTQTNYSMLFKSLGLVDERGYQQIIRHEERIRTEIKSKNWLKAQELWLQLCI